MLLDANLLLYAIDEESARHDESRVWLEELLQGDHRVGLPWQTIGAVVRIATHPKVMRKPLRADQAWELVEAWLASPVIWIPSVSIRTARIFGDLVRRHRVTGNLVPDAQLGALALEHGLTVLSADTDFGRFPDVSSRNPLP